MKTEKWATKFWTQGAAQNACHRGLRVWDGLTDEKRKGLFSGWNRYSKYE